MPLLEMIGNGSRAVDIARTLDKSKSLISYYIQKAEKLGYIKESTRDVFKLLELTHAGKDFLERCEKGNPTPFSSLRLENIIFKADVIEIPTIPVDWKKIRMHNWAQFQSKVDNISVKLNMGNKPTLELLPSAVNSDNFYDLIVAVVYDCINVIRSLQEHFGIKLGRLYVSSRPEWVCHYPIARGFSKHNGQIKYERLAMINASKPRHIGEFEFPDPRSLLDYIMMPKRVVAIEQDVEQIKSKVEEIKQLLLLLSQPRTTAKRDHEMRP